MRPSRKTAAAVFLACCALWLLGPALYFFAAEWQTSVIAELFGAASPHRPRLQRLFGATLRLALGTALLASLLGVVVALAIHRAHGAWRGFLRALYPVPLLLPPAVVAIGWTHLLGKRGLAAAYWKQVTGQADLPFSIYGEWGSVCVLALCWFPLVTMPALVGLRAQGPQALTAGRLYAGAFFRVLRVDAPLLLPYVSAGAAFVAWLALGDFDVPAVFLRNAYPIEIYAAFQSTPEVARALALCVPLLVCSALVLGVRQALVRGRQAATLDEQWTGQAPEALKGVGIQAAAVLVLAFAVGAPLASLAHQAGTLTRFGEALETAGGELVTTFRTAAGAALLAVVLGAPYARLLSRAPRPWQRAALALGALLPLAIPGTLHGIAWLRTLAEFSWGRELLESPFVISLSAAARFFPFAVFVLAATFEGLHPVLDDAARGAGASPWRAWWRVTLPLAWPGFLSAFAIVFALAAGELAAAILLQPAGYGTLPIRISALLHFGKDELLAALCLLQVAVALTPYLIASLILDRRLEARWG